MSAITKRDLILLITQRLTEQGTSIQQQDVAAVLQTFIEGVTDSLSSRNSVILRNFGSFEVRDYRQKIGRNPKSPANPIIIPARVGVKFKPGKNLADKVRDGIPSA